MRRQPTGGSNPGVLQEESRGTCIGKSNLSFYLRCPVFTSELMRIFTDIWSTLGCDPGSRFPISLCENDHNQDGSTPIVKVIQSDTTRSFHVTSRYHLQTMGFPKTPPEGKKKAALWVVKLPKTPWPAGFLWHHHIHCRVRHLRDFILRAPQPGSGSLG